MVYGEPASYNLLKVSTHEELATNYIESLHEHGASLYDIKHSLKNILEFGEHVAPRETKFVESWMRKIIRERERAGKV